MELDLVYTWVDGAEPRHLISRLWYFIQHAKTSDNRGNRWANRNELKFSLRSIDKYASFVRKIYIVCAGGQRPNFIKESDRIRFVEHSKIIPAKYLPTFNSSVIESFLHNIPGLSDFFIYSNDDCFLLRPMTRFDFFQENRAKIFLNPIVSIDGHVSRGDNGHVCGKKNANALLNSVFGFEKRLEVGHFMGVLKKEQFDCAWDMFGESLHKASLCKFRSTDLIAFTNHLIPHLMIKNNCAEGVVVKNLGEMFGAHDLRVVNWLASLFSYGGVLPENRWLNRTAERLPLMGVIDCDRITIKKFLGLLLPDKCSFECG